MPSFTRPLALALSLAALPSPASDLHLPLQSQFTVPDRWSLGFMLGAPTGAVLKRHLSGGNAWDLGLGAIYAPGVRLHGDWLWTLGQFKQDPALTFRFQIGGGAFFGVTKGPCSPYGGTVAGCDGHAYAGVRIPVLIEAWPTKAALNFGLELAPGAGIAPGGVGWIFDALVFVRFLLPA